MSFLSATIGCILPGYKTVNQWAVIYRQIIDGRPIGDKTKANRRGALTHVLTGLGDRTISAVRPHEVSAMIQRIAVLHPQTAKRLYRAQGIDTRVLLGHKHQAMTDVYNDDRGLSRGQWKTLSLSN